MSQLSWFAITVKRRFERVTASAVEAKGYEVYAPTVKRMLPSSSRAAEDAPMFPGYVLSRFDPRHRLPILTIPGVFGIVSFNRVPAQIDDSEVEDLKQVVASGFELDIGPMTVGQAVRVSRGPLAGVTGVVVEIKNVRHFAVSVSLLQRSIAVRLPIETLERIETPSAVSQPVRAEARAQAAS